jgi:hypothetical protein
VGETIVTVDARSAGYDLFTFEAIPTDRLSVPLRPTALTGASSSGQVASTDLDINLLSKSVADTRRPSPGELLTPVNACTFDTNDSRFECSFGPATIAARSVGSVTALAVQVPPSVLLFNAQAFLKGFQLALPVPPVEPGITQSNVLSFDALLDDPSLDAEERAIELTAHALTTAGWPSLSGDPLVRVEATSPGAQRAVVVGLGLAFDDGLPAGTFAVRSAIPGAADGVQEAPADELGELVRDGRIDADLLLRAEVVASDGARGGARPRLSGGEALELSFSDVLSDAAGQPGLYRVHLTDGAGLGWDVWRLDAPDASGPEAIVHLPLIDAGALPMGAGSLAVRLSAWSWGTFDPESFLWTDVEREFDRFAHSAALSVTPP